MRVFAATALLLGLADALVMPTARAAARGVAKRAGFDEENSSPAAGAGSTFGGDSPGSTFGGENMPEELKKIMANVEEGFKSSDSTGPCRETLSWSTPSCDAAPPTQGASTSSGN